MRSQFTPEDICRKKIDTYQEPLAPPPLEEPPPNELLDDDDELTRERLFEELGEDELEKEEARAAAAAPAIHV